MTVTCGFSTTGFPPPDDYTQEGYEDGSFLGAMGSLSPATFTDSDGNARTVAAIFNESQSSGGTFGGGGACATFAILGTSVPNSDRTFYGIRVNGTLLLRSNATYQASLQGCSVWSWGTLPTIPGTGSINLDIEFE